MPDGEVDMFYLMVSDWIEYYESASRILAQLDKSPEEFPRSILDDRERFNEYVKEEYKKLKNGNKNDGLVKQRIVKK